MKTVSKDMVKSCYIHIPFCKKICSYCDFCKIFYNEKQVDKYLTALEQEIDSTYKGEILETIYIGGGTPSSLSISELKRLFNIINKLNKSKNLEYTIECNFDTTTKEKLKLFKENGINRLSFGIESINEDNLKLLERESKQEEIIEIINYAKSIGFNNINIDLMYALPNETIEILNKDIDFVLSLDIEHISTYSLIIEEHTKLYINKTNNINDELDEEMYKLICKRLKEKNYYHYEISNFAKSDKYSKHNTCYWNNDEYYGFGLGASSYINNYRNTNTRSITEYTRNNYIKEKEYVSLKDKEEYEILLNLRKSEGISLTKFKDLYNVEFLNKYKIRSLLENNFLKIENDNLYIPEDKWYISNEIIVKIIEGEQNEL